MHLIIETGGISFTIEVGIWDTVLSIKQQIEMSQGVPVSKQNLLFQGKILQDDRHIIQYHIIQNSCLLLYISPDDFPNHNNNQMLHDQTNHTPAPSSNSTQQIIHGHEHWPVTMDNYNSQVLPSDSTGQDLSSMINMPSFMPETTQNISNVQDFPVKVRSENEQVLQDYWSERSNEFINSLVLQTEQSPASSNQLEEFINSQGWPVMEWGNNDQVLQTEETQESFEWIDDFLGNQDSPVTVEGKNDHQTEKSPVASNSVGATIYGQDSSVMGRSYYNESEKLLGIQDHVLPVTVGSKRNTNQVVRTGASDSVKEIINIPDSPVKKKIKRSPMKMTVMVMPFEENRRIPVEVNVGDNVEELRKELVKMQETGQINLPQERFFFIHKQDVLDDDQSFRQNHVHEGDTIEIFPGYVVSTGSTTTRVTIGH